MPSEQERCHLAFNHCQNDLEFWICHFICAYQS